MFASEPTEQGMLGVLGALLLNTEEGVDTFGRLGSPLDEVRSGCCCCGPQLTEFN